MAESICPNCRFNRFEVAKNKLQNSDKEVFFIQCASCGAVLGIVNDSNSEKVINELEEKFLKLEELITTLDHNIRVVAGKLGVR
jgi:uncharacterized Zn finger protein